MEDEDCGLAPSQIYSRAASTTLQLVLTLFLMNRRRMEVPFLLLSLPTPALFLLEGYQPMSPRPDLQEGLPLTCCVCICASQGGDRGCQNIPPGAQKAW